MKKDLSHFAQALNVTAVIHHENNLSSTVFGPGELKYLNFVSNMENRLVVADCDFDHLIFNHVHTDGVRTLFTRCDFGTRTKGIEIHHSTLLTAQEKPVIEIINDSKLRRLVIKDSIVDGFLVLDQKEDIGVILERCVFRKNFSISLSGNARCVVNIKGCLGIEKGFFSINSSVNTRDIHVVTDEFSLNMLHEFPHEYRVAF